MFRALSPSRTVAAASVIDGSSPGQSEIITALSDIKKQAAHHAACVAPQVRLELTTLRLTAECSAIELLRIIFSIHLFSYVWEREKLPFLPLPCGSRQLPTLPSRSQLSTISVWRLNFCVRYGYRWCPPAIVTGNFPSGRSLSLPVRFASLSASASRTLRFSRSLSPHLQNCTGQS